MWWGEVLGLRQQCIPCAHQHRLSCGKFGSFSSPAPAGLVWINYANQPTVKLDCSENKDEQPTSALHYRGTSPALRSTLHNFTLKRPQRSQSGARKVPLQHLNLQSFCSSSERIYEFFLFATVQIRSFHFCSGPIYFPLVLHSSL